RAFAFLFIQQQRYRCAIARLPGQRRRHHIAVVADVIDLSAGVARQGDDAIQPFAVVIKRAGAVDAHLGTIERAYLAPNLALTLGLRGLRDGIDNAAQLGLAVEYRRRTFQHFDTFECINLGARTVVVTEDRAQSILIGGDIEPAHRHPVPARIE